MSLSQLLLALGVALLPAATPRAGADGPSGAPPAAAPGPVLAGTWAGTMRHAGETRPVALELEPDTAGRVRVRLSVPVVHLDRVPLGRVEPVAEGDSLRLGPFRFALDAGRGTLDGIMPASLFPVHPVAVTLARGAPFEPPRRPPLDAPAAVPAWTYGAGAALWAGPVFAAGVVYAGAADGCLHAVDARTGARRWMFQAGGAIRTRAVVSRGVLYVQADDGVLYALDARRGALRWKVRVCAKPVERLPFDDPGSRYDRFGSDVVVAGGRLYLGTHDGEVLALDPADGRTRWRFAAGDAVLAAPAVADGHVYAGSFDGHVYALDASTGALAWKRDTRGAVVSTPALAGTRLVVGNRCYDLLGLDRRTGEVAWTRYVWMSWVESSAAVRDGVAYVGSSDAAAVFAFDAATGARRWATDVHGWAWGQPAVTASRVYVGTSGQVGYPVPHAGSVIALDRVTGRPAWRYAAAPPGSGAFGFPGSPAVGAGLVFAGGLDGRLVALPE